jgi:hypothetical protein
VVSFVGDLFAQLNEQQRAAIADMLLLSHSKALFPYSESAYDGYGPLALAVTTRHAAWSANLVVLAVLAAGEVTGTQLFPHESDPGGAWRDEALLWRSQLNGYGWHGLYQTIALRHVWDGQRREVRLWRNDGTFIPEDPDICWSDGIPPGAEARKGILIHNSFTMRRRINFATALAESIMVHDLTPLLSSFPAVANVFVALDNGKMVSAAHALLAALYAPYQEDAPDVSVYQDLACVARKLTQEPSVTDNDAYLKAALGVLISAVEQGRVPSAVLEPFAESADHAITKDAKLAELLTKLGALLSSHGKNN